jgi:hypothetical protein
VIFLYHIIRNYEIIALNRIGTHPVENLFALVRVTAHHNDSWDNFLGSISRAMVMDEVIAAHGLKSPVRRDLSIAGVRVGTPNEGENRLRVADLGHHGVAYARQLATTWNTPPEDVDLQTVAVATTFITDLQLLANWKVRGRSPRIYDPGAVASQTALSRIIGFAGDREEFVWTKRRRMLAIQLHDQPDNNDDYIASQLGCTIEQVIEFFRDETVSRNVGIAEVLT